MREFKMKADHFRRAIRFTHRFEGLVQDNPWRSPTWNLQAPVSVRSLSGPTRGQAHVQQHGEYQYCEPKSAICKPNGPLANQNGPRPDIPDAIASPPPNNTVKRKST